MISHKLPVQYSIVDSQALERLIEALYGWSNVRCQLIKGSMRDVYLVETADQQAILTLYRHGERTSQEIGAELSVMRHLNLSGVRVPTPILQVNQQNLFALAQPEGERFAVMGTYMQGHPIGRHLTADMGFRVGMLIGDVHLKLDSLVSPLNRPALTIQEAVQQGLLNVMRAIPHRKNDVIWLQTLSKRLDQHLSPLTRHNASYGLIHGDVIPSNILSQASDLILLDFDLCAYGWRAYDVASFLVEIAWWTMGDDVRNAFLNGYNSKRLMNHEELNSLPALQAVRCILLMGLAAQHVNTWGRVSFSDAIIDKFLTMIRDVSSTL